MKITLPNKNFYQANSSDNSGSLYASWNLDLLSSPSKIKVSPKTIPYLTAAGLPVAFTNDLGVTEYALCGPSIHKWTGTAWEALLNTIPTNDPTCSLYYSDICMFNGALMASLTTSVSELASGTWTPNWNSITLTEAYTPHPLCVGFNNLLCIGNGRYIVSVDTSDNVTTDAVVLPPEFLIEWIKAATNGYWIGAKNKTIEGEARVFFWDGLTSATFNYNNGYPIGSTYCFSGVIDRNNVPYVVNGYGQLLRFNGSGFEEVGKLPVADKKNYELTGYIGTDAYPPIHRNGMALIDDSVHILVSSGLNGTASTLLENQLSGIWCYTQENGLFHRFGVGDSTGTNNYDYGYPQVTSAGALVLRPKSLGSFYAGYVVNANGYIASADFTDTTRDKLGYFITPKFYAENIDEMWNNITLLYNPLARVEDYIRVKYRFVKKYDDTASQTLFTGTWVDGTNLTVPAIGDLVEGNEIELLTGRGAGLSTKITDINGTAIVIEDTVVSPSGTFTFRNEQWTDVVTIQDIISNFEELAVDKNNTQIQFKVILFGRGDSPEIERLIINSGKHQ